jgi:hypothetical protein
VIGKIPEILLDNTDRNRTSPFAFTGNKFEFRAVGSKSNCAKSITVLNAAVAQQLEKFGKEIEVLIDKKDMKKDDAIFNALRDNLKGIKNILFEGDGYSEERKSNTKLNLNHFPVQTLVDLLLIADRYEVPVLVNVCEDGLCARIEEDTAVALLVLAEQFNTYRLRRKCFEFLACHPDLLTSEILEDLPEHLKHELIGLHTWVRPNFTGNGSSLVDESKNIFTSNMAVNRNIFDGDASTVDIFAASSSVDASNMFAAVSAATNGGISAPVADINGLEEEEIGLLLDENSDNDSSNEEVGDIFS